MVSRTSERVLSVDDIVRILTIIVQAIAAILAIIDVSNTR